MFVKLTDIVKNGSTVLELLRADGRTDREAWQS